MGKLFHFSPEAVENSALLIASAGLLGNDNAVG
jgi:hypothetical protein